MSAEAVVAKPAGAPFRPGPVVELVYVKPQPTRTERVTLYGPSVGEILDEILRNTDYAAHRLVAVAPYSRHNVVEIREDVPVGQGLTIAVIVDGPPIRALADGLQACRDGRA